MIHSGFLGRPALIVWHRTVVVQGGRGALRVSGMKKSPAAAELLLSILTVEPFRVKPFLLDMRLYFNSLISN